MNETTANGTFPWEPEWANHGIAVTGPGNVSNVTVRDVTVTDWFFGVYYGGVADGRIAGVVARGNGDGISGYNGGDVTVSDGVAVGNHGGGVVLDTVAGATTRGMPLRRNADGVLMVATEGGSVVDNLAANNEDGVLLFGVNDSTIRNNTIRGSF